MIKKRNRPQPRVREKSPEDETTSLHVSDDDEDKSLPLSELLELRKIRKARQGIDVHKLSKGDVKKRRRRNTEDEPEDQGGLKAGAKVEDDDEEDDVDAKARRAVRTSNFTQQTNTLDVDKHMMAYIEENLKIRRQQQDTSESKPQGPNDEFELSERWKTDKKTADEGSVTNSLSMLTAIPEVDLGMDTRLRNIAETEKAKRQVAEERKEHKKANNDEEHLVATRFYRPHLKQKTDAEIMRDAKLEARGMRPREDRRPRNDRPQMATDEVVMERFKKRMRK
ncbi:hypothetical protein PAXINDRAFT_117267 [Paxillus involutus ATCC 200175]|uniref:Hepatocellular carcinoma-associated antigen 59-domain-containing protein n=1 Tax=Paxillus involutus ATCC 200175 TaxID=664439 RepID=A0A0C9TCH2_PAXIN|nr:hypothetical protein PAXINDRAFT_117267 [Paxillus involutus ATCC 200175]